MSSAFLSLKPPVRQSSTKQLGPSEYEFTPTYVLGRIREILTSQKLQALFHTFYVRRYVWYCEHMGFPITRTFTKQDDVTLDLLQCGDAVVMEELLNYSRIYQKTTDYFNSRGFLIYEQYIPRDSSNNLWRNISSQGPIMESYEDYLKRWGLFESTDCTQIPIFNLETLEQNEPDIYSGFAKDLLNYKSYLMGAVLIHMPVEKRERIKNGCSADGLCELLWNEMDAYARKAVFKT